MNITELDQNFLVDCNIKENTKLYNVKEPPFKIYGLYSTNPFLRLDNEVAKATSNGVYYFNHTPAGGRIRFKTDSTYIGLFVKTKDYRTESGHVIPLLSIGLDMYIKKDGKYFYTDSFVPNAGVSKSIDENIEKNGGYISARNLPGTGMKDITINMPAFRTIDDIFVFLDEDAKIEEGNTYTHTTPVVFYGSSITHGGCASRPGMTYPNIISRHLDTDIINLGFSGNAKGEEVIAKYISDLDMSVFVLDYDHNAPNVEHLKNTHERFFNIVREKKPSLPIIMVSRPKKYLTPDEIERKQIIWSTYKNALDKGDKNVYFIDGSEMFNVSDGDDFTIDGCHPTDSGFSRMAEVIGNQINQCLTK